MRAVMALVVSAAMIQPTGGTVGNPLWLAEHLERAAPGAAAARHLAAWQRIADDNGGVRATGTPGYAASADYLVDQLTQAGYAVTRQPVPYRDFAIDAEQIEELTPGADPIRVYLFRFSPSTPAGGIDLPVAAVPETDTTPGCDPADFAGLPVSGGVVVEARASCGITRQVQTATGAGA